MKDTGLSAADRRGQIGRKVRDLAAILPLLGVVFFASPLISAITGGDEGELPNAVFYIFVVWAVLIALAFILSRLLRSDAGPE